MAKELKRLVVIAAAVILTVAAGLYLHYHLRGHWKDIADAFRRADYVYVIPSVGFIALMYALRVLRWRIFLRPIKQVPHGVIASATCIGFMSSCVLPLRPGEIIRPYVLHRRGGVSFGHAAGTALGLERVFDLIGVCFLLLMTWSLMPAYIEQAATQDSAQLAAGNSAHLAGLSVQDVWRYGLHFAGLALVGLVGLVALAFFPSLVLKVAAFFLRALPQSWNRALMGLLRSIARSMEFLKNPRQVAVGLFLSCAIWIMLSLSTYSMSLGFGMELTFAGALFVQLVLTVAVAAPQAPGFILIFQLAAMTAAEVFDVPRSEAAAFANALWVVNVIPITVVGLVFLRHEGLSLRRLAEASKRAAGEAEGVKTRT